MLRKCSLYLFPSLAPQVGTPTYMSPEVVMGNNRYDAKVCPQKVSYCVGTHLHLKMRNIACVH